MKMKLKHALLITLSCLGGTWAWGQEFKPDTRPIAVQRDGNNKYPADAISPVQLMDALEMAGIRIFNFPLKPFDKEYKIHVYVREYVNGKRVEKDDSNEHPLLQGENMYFVENNTYTYSDNERANDSIRYKDYIKSLTFYTKDADKSDSTSMLTVRTNAFSMMRPLTKKITGEGESYYWRSYSKTDWTLNEEIPLLVYASSWYDEKYDVYRFCGVVDLSQDAAQTNKLLSHSPHYYIISYKVFE